MASATPAAAPAASEPDLGDQGLDGLSQRDRTSILKELEALAAMEALLDERISLLSGSPVPCPSTLPQATRGRHPWRGPRRAGR